MANKRTIEQATQALGRAPDEVERVGNTRVARWFDPTDAEKQALQQAFGAWTPTGWRHVGGVSEPISWQAESGRAGFSIEPLMRNRPFIWVA